MAMNISPIIKVILFNVAFIAGPSLSLSGCDWVNTIKGPIPSALEIERQSCIMDAMEERDTEIFKKHLGTLSNFTNLNSKMKRNYDWTSLKQPPSYISQKTTTVNIWDAEIRTIDPQINDGKVAFEGYFHMSWNDNRLTWDISQFNVPQILLSENRIMSRIWVPSFAVNETTGKGQFQTSELIIPTLQHTGQINASVFLHWTVNCDLMIRNYPQDEGKCTVRFLDDWHKEPGRVILKIGNENIRPSSVFTSPKAWKLEKGTITSKIDTTDMITKVTVSVDIVRANSFGSALVFVPIILATVLAAMAPLFGTFKWQSFVKVISLVLMYLSLGNFSATAGELMYGNGTPKILAYYQFTMIVTIVSLMVSLLIWAFARRSATIPPPRAITMITDRFAKCFLCGSTEETLEPKEDTAAIKDQWYRVYAALNCVLFVIFLIVYIIGTIVYCC